MQIPLKTRWAKLAKRYLEHGEHKARTQLKKELEEYLDEGYRELIGKNHYSSLDLLSTEREEIITAIMDTLDSAVKIKI